MQKNSLFVYIGAALVLGALSLTALFVSRNLREEANQAAAEITWCDKDASGLCILSFATDSAGQMSINFQIPQPDYPGFLVRGTNRDTTINYSCEADAATPTVIHCAGARTPLGEVIKIEVFSAADGLLAARGDFVVSALLVSTPAADPASETAIPPQTSAPTPQPGTAYPNP